MKTCPSFPSISSRLGALLVATVAASACDVGEVAEAPLTTTAGDCDASDQAGALPAKAAAGTLFDAHLSYRQTDDAGQALGAACNLATHQVTDQGMRDVPLHCSELSQAEAGFARVGARWGTGLGTEACGGNYCAVIYVQDGAGSLREVVRDIHLQDRFFCSQVSDRIDERLDVDACTYADVVGALKGTGASTDDTNLRFVNGKLAGYPAAGLSLKYRMYRCDAGISGGGCDDVPPDSTYTCAQQAGWGKCAEPWMQGFCRASCGRC